MVTSQLLHKVKQKGNILTTVLNINTKLRGIAVTHNKDLLITEGTSKLKFVNGKNGKVSDSKYSVDPLWITNVHITNDHKVIVGAVSPGAAFPVTGRRVVILMDQKGNHLTVYEQDKQKQNIFSYVEEITSISNGNIFAVDSLSGDNRERLLVLGKDGDLLNEYTGCQYINTEDKLLQIANITTTASDNIVVIDFDHHLHILDSSASLTYYYDTETMAIEYPYCLVFTCPTTYSTLDVHHLPTVQQMPNSMRFSVQDFKYK
ncbi:unnamed protein product [Mytilus coruscus]|uniref:Uncharacterized protein n=1 Tax=Mytilus coruscus TaxID=42192 RepID=A0A6J8C3U4_MYTCO|nr:unnamed protein product [Mytilus coruscus]